MSDLVTEHADYDAFAREWHADDLTEHDVTLQDARERGLLNEQETRQLWQLVGLLEEEDLVVHLPEWLVEKKVGFTERATPTTFVGHVARETEKAILFEGAAARSLMQLAHRIHSLENGLENAGVENDRRERLERRLQERRREFERREDAVGLSGEWLPKSQLSSAIRRSE